jgi:uncharacterized protein YegP (UPF0339 family)
MTYRVSVIEPYGWRWQLVASNGRAVATSNGFFRTEQGAIKSARRVIDAQRAGLWHIETPNESSIGASP